jgi:arginine decarboxylase
LTTAIEQTLETYGIENWAAGYFDVNRKGNLIVRPVEGDPRSADLKEIIDDHARATALPAASRSSSKKTSTRIQPRYSRV